MLNILHQSKQLTLTLASEGDLAHNLTSVELGFWQQGATCEWYRDIFGERAFRGVTEECYVESGRAIL